MQIVFLASMFVFGACIGSFLCCQARRLRIKEQGSKAAHKTKSKSLPSRSICLHCKKTLKWYDNLPIISWLILRGRCRYCHQKIGLAEFLSELLSGLAFLALSAKFFFTYSASALATTPSLIDFSATPFDWLLFIITLLFTVFLIFLAIYDGLYGELPTTLLLIALLFAVIILTLKTTAILASTGFTPDLIWQPALSILVLAGTYLALYIVSKGKWVGDGDWLLALALALALANSWLALITLFLANLLACLFSLKSFQNPKKAPKIHLGPFLVAAFIIVTSLTEFFLGIIK